MCCTNDFYGTRRRVEWMLTPLLSVPLAVVDPWGGTDESGNAFAPKLELASNEFLTEFAFKIRKIPSGFAFLVRQSREQATVGRTHASMSVGGHALPPHTLI